jgi:hypothetical protein
MNCDKCKSSNCLICKNKEKGILTVKLTMLFFCKNHYLNSKYIEISNVIFEYNIGNSYLVKFSYLVKLEILNEDLICKTNKLLFEDNKNKIADNVIIYDNKNDPNHFYILFNETLYCAGSCNKKKCSIPKLNIYGKYICFHFMFDTINKQNFRINFDYDKINNNKKKCELYLENLTHLTSVFSSREENNIKNMYTGLASIFCFNDIKLRNFYLNL